jgi:hypothetical protein
MYPIKARYSTVFVSFLIIASLFVAGCGGSSGPDRKMKTYSLGPNAQGAMEFVDNIYNLTVVSKDDNVLKAEYEAGFIQGKLQGKLIVSTRDNYWDILYLTDPSHSFPQKIPPTPEELALALGVLDDNYAYTIDYIKNQKDPVVAQNLKRLLFRMLGVYHGAVREAPAPLDFSGSWLPELSSFDPSELQLGYGTPGLTFMDVYFINAFTDVTDVIAKAVSAPTPLRMPKCSAFVKKTADDIFIAHNSWFGYLAQSMATNLYVNDTFMTFNALAPGLISSLTDFGYNNRGIMFNETTHHATYTEPKRDALWTLWRASLAEQFAGTLDEFFDYLSLEPSGTYMNGYMVVDMKTREIGLVEMSYKNFVFFKPNGQNGYDVITKPDGLYKGYDPDMVTPNYIFGINYPASYQIRDDLKAIDNRPARRYQFLMGIGGVNDIESAKALITYTDPNNPLSIYGRWDLGYGLTPTPKTVPDGSIDAKAFSADMASYALHLEGTFDLGSPYRSFWMKYGTPHISGKPFIWSESQWKGQKLRDVPDVVDGSFHLLNLYIR